jgi:hypothetical protein
MNNLQLHSNINHNKIHILEHLVTIGQWKAYGNANP